MNAPTKKVTILLLLSWTILTQGLLAKEGRVVGILDGDTIEALDVSNKSTRVRLSGH